MRTAEDLLPDVLPSLPGANMPALDLALRRAAQELCKRSRCWSVWTEPVALQDGVTEYDVDTPPGATVDKVTGCTMDGKPHDILPWQWADRGIEDINGATPVTRSGLTFETGGQGSGQAVRLKVVLVPDEHAQGIEDFVFDEHRAALASGVIAKMASTPGQMYTNPELAAAHGASFDAYISRLTVAEYQGRSNAMPRARVGWC